MNGQVEVLTTLQELELDRQRISRAADRIFELHLELNGGVHPLTGEKFEGVELEYQRLYDEELIEMEERALAAERRLPPADVRDARVRKKIREEHPEVYTRRMNLSAELGALRHTISTRKSAIGAAQSILKGEKS